MKWITWIHHLQSRISFESTPRNQPTRLVCWTVLLMQKVRVNLYFVRYGFTHKRLLVCYLNLFESLLFWFTVSCGVMVLLLYSGPSGCVFYPTGRLGFSTASVKATDATAATPLSPGVGKVAYSIDIPSDGAPVWSVSAKPVCAYDRHMFVS